MWTFAPTTLRNGASLAPRSGENSEIDALRCDFQGEIERSVLWARPAQDRSCLEIITNPPSTEIGLTSDRQTALGPTSVSPADGHLAGRLRQEQARLLCCSRHAPTASRHSPSSQPRVRLLGRHSDERRPLATRWPPPTSRRSCGSAAGAAGASRWHFPPLPLVTGT